MRRGSVRALSRSAALATVLAGSAMACKYPATTVRVVVDTDARERVVAMRVRSARGATVRADTMTHAWGRDAGARSNALVWPASFVLHGTEGELEGSVALEVEVDYAPLNAGQPTLTTRRTARFSYLPRAEGVVRMVLNAGCAATVAAPARCRDASVVCTVSRYCEEQSPAQTCGDDGRCVAVDVVAVVEDGGAASRRDATSERDSASDSAVEAGRAPQVVVSSRRRTSDVWSEVATSGDAPVGVVRGAFAIQGSNELNVLSATELFVLRLSDRRWVEGVVAR